MIETKRPPTIVIEPMTCAECRQLIKEDQSYAMTQARKPIYGRIGFPSSVITGFAPGATVYTHTVCPIFPGGCIHGPKACDACIAHDTLLHMST